MKTPRPFAGKRRRGFAIIVGIAVGQSALAVGMAFIVRFLFNALAGLPASGETGKSVVIGIATLIVLLLAWMRRWERVAAESLGQSYAHDVRLALYSRLGSLTPRDLQGQSKGGHLLRFIGDLTALRQWITLGLARLIVGSVTATSTLAALCFINLNLAAAVALLFFLGCMATLIMGKRLHVAIRVARKYRSRLASDISERIIAMPVVQMFSQVRRERSRIERRSSDLGEAMVNRARVIGNVRAIAETTAGISVVAVLVVGGVEVAQGRATPGSIVAAMFVLGFLTPALRDIGRAYEYWHGYAVAIDRIEAFNSMRPSVRSRASATAAPITKGELQFDRVKFDGVLQGLSATAAPGAKIAIIGPNGSGKSSLLALVAQLVKPTSGKIKIDGHDIRKHSVTSIREAIGAVSPDLPLLRGTVGRNIRYRFPNASASEVQDVCALCGVDEVLRKIPDGLEGRIVEGGLNLSLGERQRIALARALLGRPKILLLDEFDANLDPKTAALVNKVIRQQSGTVLFVSHRLEQIIEADAMWHIRDGLIVEQGVPSDLLSREGPTRSLFKRQLMLAS